MTEEEKLVLIEAMETYVEEVHYHMQDEQGDQDSAACERARRIVYDLLGLPVPEEKW